MTRRVGKSKPASRRRTVSRRETRTAAGVQIKAPVRYTGNTTVRQRIQLVPVPENMPMIDPAVSSQHFEKAKAMHAYIRGILSMPATAPGTPNTKDLTEMYDQFIIDLKAARGMGGATRPYWGDSKKIKEAIKVRGKERSAAGFKEKLEMNKLIGAFGKANVKNKHENENENV